ncbi:MAG: hypothetical protein ACNA8W_14020 [Bradymonadaceae bacterium]
MASDEPYSQIKDVRAGDEDWMRVKAGKGRSQGDQIQRFFEMFKLLLRRSPKSVLAPFVVTVVVDFVFVAASVMLIFIWGGPRPWERMPAGVSGAVQVIGLVQVILVYTLRVALFKTLREVAHHGAESVGGIGEVFRDIGPRLVPVFLINLIVFALVAVGLMLCVIPGLVAIFFLAFAPYLVAARGLQLGDALQTSARIARHQWLLLVTAIAVAFAALLAMGCVGLGGNLILIQPLGRLAIPTGMVGAWVMHAVVGFFAWIYWGAVYITAETAEEDGVLTENRASQQTELPLEGGEAPA